MKKCIEKKCNSYTFLYLERKFMKKKLLFEARQDGAKVHWYGV